MLWELATPVFVGTLLALVVVVFMMGNLATLAKGPRQLAARVKAGLRAGLRGDGCTCGHPGGNCACGACPKTGCGGCRGH